MSLTMRWVGEADVDRVIEARLRSFGASGDQLTRFKDSISCDGRAKPGDYLLAERDGRAVGTTTSLDMTMWVRGSPLSCQGVAYVGAIKTERRKARESDGATERRSDEGIERSKIENRQSKIGSGLATALMHETLRKARERNHVLTALMPFRASFYAHFGYGLVERRCDWTVPLSILPPGDCEGFRFMDPADRPAIAAASQRMVERGQCDIESPAANWDQFFNIESPAGFIVVDQPTAGTGIHGWLFLRNEAVNGRDAVRVVDQVYDSPAAFQRQLHYLVTLRDQYSAAILTTPSDLPLSSLLREPQIPHRPINHPTAELRPYTRMQVRILDHVRFLEALHLPEHHRGQAVIAVHESEGHISRFRLQVESGRATASPCDASPDVEMADRTWAAIACGDLPADAAARWSLIQVVHASALAPLRALSDGLIPYCSEFF